MRVVTKTLPRCLIHGSFASAQDSSNTCIAFPAGKMPAFKSMLVALNAEKDNARFMSSLITSVSLRLLGQFPCEVWMIKNEKITAITFH